MLLLLLVSYTLIARKPKMNLDNSIAVAIGKCAASYRASMSGVREKSEWWMQSICSQRVPQVPWKDAYWRIRPRHA